MPSPAGHISAFPILSESAALIEDGRLEQAAQRTMAHLHSHPDEPRGLAQLGLIAMKLGALGQAEQFVRQSMARGANDFDTRRLLASILNQQERLDDAEALFGQLVEENSDPTLPAVRAQILDKLGCHQQASDMQKDLAIAHAGNPHFLIAYGHNLRASGDVDQAIATYRQAVESDFECGEAWWALANIKSKVLSDADVIAMRQALDIAIDIRNSAPLHFALARALHDRKQYADAFRHYSEGNRQRADSIGYQAGELDSEVSETERLINATDIAAMSTDAVGNAVPIFIVSLPRSGSTLLEQMLGSHGEIEAAGELPYVPALLRSAIELATRRGQITVPALVKSIDGGLARSIGTEYLRRAALHRKTDRPYFIDKLPHNWSNILFIRKILPQARFIEIRRSAMDCCFSNFSQSFSSAHASSFSLEHIGRTYQNSVRLMEHLDRIAPGLVYHLRYEALVESPEAELRSVLDYLDLEWTTKMLDFHQLERVVRTPSSEQVRRPLNRDGIKVWAPYSDWLGPLRSALGPLADQ